MIISICTYKPRIKGIEKTLNSLINQSISTKIICWVAGVDINIMPVIQGVEYREVPKDYRSFNKLLWTLREYPQETIITVDDDYIYPYTFVEGLLQKHNAYPDDIICYKGRNVVIGKNYKEWKYTLNGTNCLPIGAFGILYPPDCFTEEIFDEKFLDLCDTGDDLWFFIQSKLNGKKTRCVGKPLFAFKRMCGGIPLGEENIKKGKNVIMMNNLLKHYNLTI